jgi:TDG/mug DNA glycosylase family protein
MSSDLEAARGRFVPDVLPGAGDPPLRVLFCGINPGLTSARSGYHFARPGNRFWPALFRSGFTDRQLRPDEQALLPGYGLGVTNIVARASARADELAATELVEGGQRLRDLVGQVRPSWLAVVGITAYRIAFASPRAQIGPQQLDLGETGVWVLPNPSGLNAHWPLPALVEEFARLRVAATGAPEDA